MCVSQLILEGADKSWTMSLSQFSLLVVASSLRPHQLQHAGLPCPSPALGAFSNLCPSSQWHHPTISSSVVPFSFYLQSFPTPGSFPMSHLFASGGQSIRVSVSASVLTMNIQDSFPLGLTGLISLQSKGLSRIFSNTKFQNYKFFGTQLSLWSNSHIHMWLLEKPKLWPDGPLLAKSCLLFNMLSRFIITFLSRSMHLLISWLQSPSALILEPPKIKSVTISTVSPSICHEVMGQDAMILVFWIWVLSQLFHSPLSLSSRGSLVPLHFLP